MKLFSTSLLLAALVAVGSASLIERHGTKYAGQICSTNADCYSANCVHDPSYSNPTCQLQPQGGPCFKGANCVSGQCDLKAGKCKALVATGGPCKRDTNCYTGQCGSGKCVLADPNRPCSNDNQCYTGSCLQNECDPDSGCFTPTYSCSYAPPLGTCRTTDDCGSNYAICDSKKQCIVVDDGDCYADDVCESGFCQKPPGYPNSVGFCEPPKQTTTTTTKSQTKSTTKSKATSTQTK
ncbi:hypothetical protein OC861_000624 [Tilletia horrida]|nr:hypothetical protein OC845_000767 [Tilletia horrida]KAK0569787.1 hypothetical protein OC861_000624 [Tilletia horrida]